MDISQLSLLEALQDASGIAKATFASADLHQLHVPDSRHTASRPLLSMR